MHGDLRSLIAECIQLEQELGLITPVMPFLNPSWNVREPMKETVPASARIRFAEKWNSLGGWDKISIEYALQEKHLETKLSDLAELLDEEEFEIEKFRSRVPGDQFGWLVSRQGQIKKHLRGIHFGDGG